MKVALVHDYLNQRGGAERVFAHIARAYPDAPVFTALHDPERTRDLVDPSRVRVSGLQRLPGAGRYFRFLAPFYPAAFERFDLSGYDTIVSSTTSWAKGVIVPPGAVHVAYLNAVSRFAFAYDAYVGGLSGAGATLARPLVQRLVDWDLRAAQRPTALVANSRNVARRIEQYYGRSAYVLPCPVDVDRFTVGPGDADYFVAIARLLPYKRIDVAIAACARAGVPLYVVGSGPAEAALRAAARGTATRFCGVISDPELDALVGRARGVIVAAEEDFGLVALEAAAAGRPTIAFRGGGALETIVEGVTGAFFDAPEPASLAAAIAEFDQRRYDPATLRAHAETFAPARFVARLQQIVEEVRASAAPFVA
jgi:glycosyltransferase involved in cell wall biosynthesis